MRKKDMRNEVCRECGGDYIGNGYNSPIHCENVECPIDWECDANPLECPKRIKCWGCDGKGVLLLPFRPVPPVAIMCDRCGGEGLCPEIMLEWQKEGQKYKQKRIDLKLTLKDAAIAWKIDAGVLSQAERGIIDPNILNEKGL